MGHKVNGKGIKSKRNPSDSFHVKKEEFEWLMINIKLELFPSPKFPTFLTTKAIWLPALLMSNSSSPFFKQEEKIQGSAEYYRDQQRLFTKQCFCSHGLPTCLKRPDYLLIWSDSATGESELSFQVICSCLLLEPLRMQSPGLPVEIFTLLRILKF